MFIKIKNQALMFINIIGVLKYALIFTKYQRIARCLQNIDSSQRFIARYLTEHKLPLEKLSDAHVIGILAGLQCVKKEVTKNEVTRLYMHLCERVSE